MKTYIVRMTLFGEDRKTIIYKKVIYKGDLKRASTVICNFENMLWLCYKRYFLEKNAKYSTLEFGTMNQLSREYSVTYEVIDFRNFVWNGKKLEEFK